MLAWSLVIPVSCRKVDVRTPETLVRSIAIHVNINCDQSDSGPWRSGNQFLTYREKREEEEVGFADYFSLLTFAPHDEDPSSIFVDVLPEKSISKIRVLGFRLWLQDIIRRGTDSALSDSSAFFPVCVCRNGGVNG